MDHAYSLFFCRERPWPTLFEQNSYNEDVGVRNASSQGHFVEISWNYIFHNVPTCLSSVLKPNGDPSIFIDTILRAPNKIKHLLCKWVDLAPPPIGRQSEISLVTERTSIVALPFTFDTTFRMAIALMYSHIVSC